MTRALLPALLAATLLLSACGSAPKLPPAEAPANDAPAVSTPDPAPSPVPNQTAKPAKPGPGKPSGSKGSGTKTDTAEAPGHVPPQSDVKSGADEPIAVQPKPAIKWYAPGIGMPLKSDDPAAQGKKVVVLTFDDGPTDTGTTVQILDTLAEHNVKAMFFITGYNARNRDLVERIHREGHVLGPHTMTHPNLATLTVPQMREEIEPLIKLIEEVTGEKPKYLRPPFGSYNQALIDLCKEYGMEVLNWTNGSLDWEGTRDGYKEPKLVVDDVMRQMHRGAVVLMHDTLRHTAEALPEILRQISADGYEFITLK